MRRRTHVESGAKKPPRSVVVVVAASTALAGILTTALVGCRAILGIEDPPNEGPTYPDGGASDEDGGATTPLSDAGTSPGTDGSNGGGDASSVTMVDCVEPANETNVKCMSLQSLQVGTVGSGPKFTGGFTTQVNHGFVSGNQLIVAVEFSAYDDEYGGIFSVDLTDGHRTLLSGKINDPIAGEISRGTGPAGKSLNAVSDVSPGPNNSWIALAMQISNSNRLLFKIDPATGNRQILFDAKNVTCEGIAGVNVAFDIASGLSVGPDGAMYLALNHMPQGTGKGVARVTPDGKCTMVSLSGATNSANNHGAGPLVVGTFLYNVTFNNNAIYLLQFNTHPSILSIDPLSGNRTMISMSPDKGIGPDLANQSMAIGPDGTFYTYHAESDGVYGLVSVDPKTGNRTALEPKGGPAKKAQGTDRGIWVHPDGKHLLLQYANAILLYDPATGNSNTLSY